MSPSAADVITYVGVPLAVIGVLPILYNAVVTLLHWYKITTQLRSSNIDTKVRVDAFNRIVDVRFNRYLVRPPPWDTGHILPGDTWTPTPSSASIRGGSWRRLPWELRWIGTYSQRTLPGDELRQPPAKIYLSDLLIYLYDLGALPVVEGWSELMDRGLWTQKGCVLMAIDGQPALQVDRTRDEFGDALVLEVGSALRWTSFSQRRQSQNKAVDTVTMIYGSHGQDLMGSDDGEATPERKVDKTVDTFITCSFTAQGVKSAYWEDSSKQQSKSSSNKLRIGHLTGVTRENDRGAWFAACCAALYAQTSTPLLHFSVPAHILDVARTCTVPQGVLEALAIIDDQRAAIPDAYDATPEPLEDFSRHELRDTKTLIRDEAVRREASERAARIDQALDTPLLQHDQVSIYCLEWLKSIGCVPVSSSTSEALESMLSQMVIDPEFASNLCVMLNSWKSWSAKGRMTVGDFEFVEQHPRWFAQASLVMGTLEGLITGPGKVLLDMQMCLDMWETVLLA